MRTRNDKGVYVRSPMVDRFWEKVDRRGTDECWLWKGAVRNGYGYITDFWQKFYVHRYAYELAYAPIPPGRWIQVLHSCDVRLCVNPRHLWLGTAQANATEAVDRNRTTRGERNNRAKVTDEIVREMRRRYTAGETTQVSLAQELDICQATVSRIIHRETWKHVD